MPNQPQPSGEKTWREKVKLAAITGVISGAVRGIIACTLEDHL
jgi:hypothetical protein